MLYYHYCTLLHVDPEIYMRTLRKLILFAVLIPALALMGYVPAVAAEPFRSLAAAAALLADADSGMVLYESNTDVKHPADALSKIMTLLLTVSACESGAADQDEIVEMTESAYYNIVAQSTTQNIVPGEKMPLIDLMYCAYIGSANEACNLLAEYIAGSIPSFISNMNARAKELGCRNTNFVNANGQYSDRQYTTAADLYIIFREAMSHPIFVDINGTYRYEVSGTNISEARRLLNTNELLNPNSKYYYKPCSAGKTSATFEGGYSLVAFAEANELTLISVVLGSDDLILEDESVDLRNFSETQRLFDWGFSNFSRRTILLSSDPVGKAPVMHGAGADFVNLRPESSITLLLDNDISDKDFTRTVTIYPVENDETLYAPVYAGDVLGEITLTLKGVDYGTVLLVANTDVELNRLQFIRTQISEMLATKTARRIIWILVAVVIGYIALVVRYNVIRRKRLRRIAEAKKKLIAERQSGDHDWE